MKFKKGDIIICTSNNGDWMTDAYLKIGGRYTVKRSHIDDNIIYLEESKLDYPYHIQRFMTIEEYRSLKIKKIKDGFQKRG